MMKISRKVFLTTAIVFATMILQASAVQTVDASQISVQIPKQLSVSGKYDNAAEVPLSRFLTRDWQQKNPRVKGGFLKYKAVLKEPVRENFLLEFEYPATVRNVFGDGKKLADISTGHPGRYHSRGNAGRCHLLPKGTKVLEYEVYDFPFRFENHTGSLTIRPLKQADTVRLRHQIRDTAKDFTVKVDVSSIAGTRVPGIVRLTVLDRFGAVLRKEEHPVVAEKQAKSFSISRQTPEDHKLVAEFQGKDKSITLPYWTYFRNSGKNGILLDWGWKWKKVSAQDAFKNMPDEKNWRSDFPRKYPAEPAGLPLFKSRSLKTHRLWVKNEFEVPKEWQGRKIMLELDSIAYKGRFYVNGQFAGEIYNRELPGALDLTKYLKPGKKNTLLIAITDHIVNLNPKLPEPKDDEFPEGERIDSGDHISSFEKTGLSSVPILRMKPEISAENLEIRTAAAGEKRILKAGFKLKNNTEKEQKVKLDIALFERGKLAFDGWKKEVVLKPSGTCDLSFEKDFPKAKLWDFGKPNLYEFRITLSSRGKELASFSERFGFREWKISGTDFMLNGNKKRLIGESQGIFHYWAPYLFHHPVMPTNVKLNRTSVDNPYTDWELNVCDEAGIATTLEMKVSPYGRPRAFLLGSDLLYKNLKTKWNRLIPRYGNHPSVFVYTLGNEPPTENPEQCAKMADLERYVMAADPSRFSFFSRGNDLNGLSRFYIPHYLFHIHVFPTDLNLFNAEKPTPRIQRQQKHKDSYENVRMVRGKDKPVFDTEGASVTDGRTFAWKYGEEALIRYPWNVWESTSELLIMDAMRAYIYECYRKNNLSVMAHIGGRAGDDAISDLLAVFHNEEYHLFSDKPALRTISIINDSPADDEITVILKIHRSIPCQKNIWNRIIPSFKEDESLFHEEKKTFFIKSGEIFKWNVEIPPLSVQKPEYLNVSVEAFGEKAGNSGKRFYRFTVYPQTGLDFPLARLFDPAGDTAKSFQNAGINIKQIKDLSKADGKILIIGKNSLAKTNAEILNKLVKQGLRVLVLQQNNLTWDFPFEIIDGDNGSNGAGAVISDPAHPAFRDIVEDDLRYWQNAERIPLVYENAPETPHPAVARQLLQGSQTRFTGDMNFSPLVEAEYGKGIYLISALSFTEALPYDPAAQKFFANLMDHLAKAEIPEKKGSALISEKNRNVFCTRQKMDPAKNRFRPGYSTSLLLADPKAPLTKEMVEMVRSGGTLFVQDPDPSRMKELKKFFGIQAEFKNHDSEFAVMTVRDPLFAGLTQYHFIWGSVKGGHRKPNQNKLVGAKEIIAKGKMTPLLLPNYLTEFPVGKGRVILSTLRFEKTISKQSLYTLGVISRNLGLVMESEKKPEAKFVIPEGKYQYDPLDLKDAVNIGFEDRYPGDKKGGWCDNGAKFDFRMLPRGDQKFCGIPVKIGNGAITVKGSVWNEMPNQSKEIKVGKKLDKIFLFLNSSYVSAKRGDEIARCVIWYEDRKDWIPGKAEPFVRFSIRHNRNVADWYFADKAASGDLKLSDARVAWRANGSNSNRGVYVTEWVNPFPNRKIDAIMLEGVGAKAQVFLVGATGAIEKKTTAIRPELVPVEKRPDWAKKNKWCFKVDTDEYTCYLDGSAFILGICTKDGKRVLGQSCVWLMQYRDNGKFRNYQEYGNIPKLKVFKSDNELSMILPPAKGKLLEWERKIIFQGKEIKFDFAFRFQKSFLKIAETTDYLSLFARFSFPGFSEKEASPEKLILQKDGFTWQLLCDPASARSEKEWSFNKKTGMFQLNAENFKSERKKADSTFRIRLILQGNNIKILKKEGK